jgi:hypothetical protein
MHIDNLYKNQDILLFKECYAMEKIHGTSAHISWNEGVLHFFSGGTKYEDFVKIFNDDLMDRIALLGQKKVVVYGESYGGKCQGMSKTYGKDNRFVAFEVRIGESWLDVLNAQGIVESLGLDFVPFIRCSTDLDTLNYWRDQPSIQAKKNGTEGEHKREGVVLRPIIEVIKNNGQRIIAKHKSDDFMETKTPRSVDKDKLQILSDAEAIALEWVTEMRLTHVLQDYAVIGIEQTGSVISSMIADVEREAEGEIIESPEARRAINRRTAIMFKNRLKQGLG